MAELLIYALLNYSLIKTGCSGLSITLGFESFVFTNILTLRATILNFVSKRKSIEERRTSMTDLLFDTQRQVDRI
jgi:hypothetical protein